MTKSKRVVLSFLFVAACSGTDQPKPAASGGDPDAEAMQRGLTELAAGRATAAQAHFREILGRTPTHYGAHYQLAVALDRGGKPAEARREWEAVRKAAEGTNDTATMRTAAARLAAPDTAGVPAMMEHGLDLLYSQSNFAGAADQFRKVLERNPTHYGATYQLATALDRAGQRREARTQWERVLGMANGYRDTATVRTARARLAEPR